MDRIRSTLVIVMLGLVWSTGAHAASDGGKKSQKTADDESKALTIGIAQEFGTLNPIISQMGASTFIHYMTSQPLVSINKDWQWQCWLCQTLPTLDNGMARIKKDENGKEYLLVDWKIRDEATWGDGTPVTGHDVKLSWEIGRHENVSTASKDIYERIVDISVDEEDPKKFTMRFHEARYDFSHLGTFDIVAAHAEKNVFEKAKEKSGLYEKRSLYTRKPTKPALYNGPYVPAEIKPSSHVILKRNPEYGGPRPDIDKIVIKYVPKMQTLDANLLAGDIDMIGQVGMTFEQARSLEKRLEQNPDLKKRYEIVFADSMIYEHVDLNLRNPILTDIRVRKALVYGINRKKMVEALFEGRQSQAISMIHPKDLYYTEDLPQHSYDPKRARELLKEAGWKKGDDGIRRKDGEELSLTIMTTAGNKTRELVETYLQEQLEKIGVKIRIKNQPVRVFFGETVRKAKFKGMALYAWKKSPDNPPRTTLHSDEIPTRDNGYSGQNFSGWRNKTVDKLLDQILHEFDPKKRIQMMKTIQREYAREVPVIPLYWRSDVAVIPKNLEGFHLTGHQFFSTLNVDQWKLVTPQTHE